MVRVASECESGWEFIINQWQDAAFGFAGLSHTSIGHSAPSEQARFWLKETNRVLEEHPRSASLPMGAAWVLDSPGIGFLEDHLQQSALAQAIPQMGLELDEEAISREKSRFREKCIGQCLEFAREATQHAPTDVRWWRMRALLQFEGDTFYSGQEFKPRDHDWLAVLDECKKHDAENALYDYLAALHLWNESASYDWPLKPEEESFSNEMLWNEWGENDHQQNTGEEPSEAPEEEEEYWILTIHDTDGFAAALQRFREAQEKPFLAIGEAGYSSIIEFLDRSRLRKADQAEVAVSRLVTFRHSTLFHQLWRWQGVRESDAQKKKDFKQQMEILLENLRLNDQAIAPEEISALNTLSTFGFVRQSTYDSIVKLNQSMPTILEPLQMERIQVREKELRIETATLQSALSKLNKGYPDEYFTSWPAISSAVTSTSAASLLVAAGVLLLFAKVLTRSNDTNTTPAFGTLRHAIVWIFGCGSTFFVLGMAPAEMISHEVQRVTIISGIWLSAVGIIAIAVGFVIKLLRQRKIRFRLITLFAVTTGVAMLASLWPLMKASLDGITQYPSELWLHAKGWSGIDAEILRIAMKLEKGTWYWAVMQWFSHGGPYIGLAVSLLLTAGWFMLRIARKTNQAFLKFWTTEIRLRWAMLLSFLGHSAFVAAACWVLLYLCIVPKAIQLTEAEFQYQMKYCRDPKAHWTEIRDVQAVIVGSVEDMKTIREQVQFEMFGEGFLEKDFSRESE